MKRIVLTILIVLIAGICYADDISISASTDRQEIALDEQITLNITVTGSVTKTPQLNIPVPDGLTAYSSGRSQKVSIINGQITGSVSFNYTIVPNDVGDYTLGPFTIDYKGKTYSAESISVKVTPRTTKQHQASSYTYPQVRESHKELFIETYVDKLRAYVNEQVTLTFAFYQAVNLFENPVYKPPSTTGFWAEDMPPQTKSYKVIDGQRYLVTEIRTALFATSSGEFTIGQARLEASVEDLERFSSRSPFDIFNRDAFSMFRRGKPIILTTEPIEIEILPLPEEDKPLNFKGDVGRFDITASVDKKKVEEGQPVTLKIKIKGTGNIKTVSSPNIPEIPDAKLYDSGSSENISKQDYTVQGEKIFEKVIIPKRDGRFEIGPIGYSYFDPIAKRYIKKNIGPIYLDVTESEEAPITESVMLVPGLSKEEVRLLKKDIRYIKTKTPNLQSRHSYLYNSMFSLLIVILPAFLLVFLCFYEFHRERLRQDIGYARSRRAKGMVSRRLKKANRIMDKGDAKIFYAEIYKATIEYIADKLNIPHPSITKDILEARLKDKAVPPETIEKLKSLFDICDMARFASVNFTKKDMKETLEDASCVVSELGRIR